MAVFRYRMTYDRFPAFSREYEVKDSNTLYDLHRFIQNDVDFDEAQLAAFHTSDDRWSSLLTHAIFDTGDGAMDDITIEQLVESGVERLLYVFDIFNNRSFKLQLLGEVEAARLASYPRVVASKGEAPDQLVETDPLETLHFLEGAGKPKPDSIAVGIEDDEEGINDEEEDTIEDDEEADEDEDGEEIFVEEELQ